MLLRRLDPFSLSMIKWLAFQYGRAREVKKEGAISRTRDALIYDDLNMAPNPCAPMNEEELTAV